MPDALIFDHVRTPRGRGKKDGSLHEVTAVELAATTLRSIRGRNGIEDTKVVDDVVLGCVDPVGEAGADIARAAVFRSGYDKAVPGVQINRFCASGLDAINFGAGEITSGQHDLVIAGGVESMSRVGIGASGGAWPVDPQVALPSYFMPQGVSADLIATKYGFSRDDCDAYAIESQKRAAHSWDKGYFKNSVIPVTDMNGLTILDKDEHMRPDATMQSLGQLNASFEQMGEFGGFDAVGIQAHPEVERIKHVHHAGNSSGIVDGAAAVLIGNARAGKKLGVDLENVLISQPDTGEQALEIADTLVRSGAIDVLVVDSVAALTPKAELEGEMGDSLPGLQARLMSQALRKLTGSISKSRCMVIFINQIRMKIGVMFGSPETTSGGNALKFYASVRLDIRRIGAIKERDEVVGNQTRVKVVKNKVAPPFKQVEFDIMYGEGVSKMGELIDLGVKAGIVEKSGSWFSYDSERIGQGRENAKTYLKEHPEMAERIEQAIRQSAGLLANRILDGDDMDEDDGDAGSAADEETVTAIAGGGRKSKRG